MASIAERCAQVDTAVSAGAARPDAFGGALVTLDSAQTIEAARMLGARRVVPNAYPARCASG